MGRQEQYYKRGPRFRAETTQAESETTRANDFLTKHGTASNLAHTNASVGKYNIAIVLQSTDGQELCIFDMRI